MRIQDFDYSVDLLSALLWQYNDAARLQSLIAQKQDWYNGNQSEFWSDWFTNVFNLQTANDFGLEVWSIILNVPLSIGPGPDPTGKPIFGFGSETMTLNSNLNFGNSNFSNGGGAIGLTTDEKRILLRLRYFQLTSRCAIPEINRFLKTVFINFGSVYVLDGLDMTIKVIFLFQPSTKLFQIIHDFDLIPRGSGVGIKYLILPDSVFGFGSDNSLTPNSNRNFENGNFLEDLNNGGD